jgi:hypothetical protein
VWKGLLSVTDDQFNTLMAALNQLHADNATLIWIGTTAIAGIGFVWGAILWRLIMLSKNQSYFW